MSSTRDKDMAAFWEWQAVPLWRFIRRARAKRRFTSRALAWRIQFTQGGERDRAA